MLSIERNEITAEGTLHTQMVDYMMLSQYIYEQMTAEFGERAAKRFIQKDMPKLLKRGIQDANNSTQ